MNELSLMRIEGLEVKEKRFDGFTCYEFITKNDKGNKFTIKLFTRKGISWFKELEEITTDLEAHPDSIQDTIERLQALVPLEA